MLKTFFPDSTLLTDAEQLKKILAVTPSPRTDSYAYCVKAQAYPDPQ